MKNFMILALAFLLLAAALPAAADSVWTPMDDYFMDTWSAESDQTCEFVERPYYLAAGERGYVTAVRTPLNQTPLETYPNGTEFKVSFICGKGDSRWGAVEAIRMPAETAFTENWQGTNGYIAVGDLVRAFDTEAFSEVHQSEIVPFDKDSIDLCAVEEFVVWTSPNSGSQLEYVSQGYISWLCQGYDPETPGTLFKTGGLYVDPAGKRWVEITLRRSTEHGWFCLDAMADGAVKPVY